MVFVVGLTGGIGCGKTAITDRFEALGVTIADADVAAREVVEPGQPALAEITDHFGAEILNKDGTLNRAGLRSIVFKDPAERKWLESVTVPAILKRLRFILDHAESSYAILMLSSGGGQSPWIDRHLVVDVDPETQIERVMARDGNTREEVEAIMKVQPSRAQRLAYADDVITNDGDLARLDKAVADLHESYLRMAKQ